MDSNFQFDPNEIDTEEIRQQANDVADIIDQEAARERQQQQIEQTVEKRKQQKAESEDVRNKKDGGGFKGVLKEAQSAIQGGLQDTASSLVTAPERLIDMASGKMVREGKDYDPVSDDFFVDSDNPIETKTVWGNLLRGFVHFGSLAVIPVKGQAALGIKIGNRLLNAAAIGATTDILSKYSQEDNALGAIAKRYPQFSNVLATKDEDHPAMKTFKNVMEGMGIGLMFDGAAMAIGKVLKKDQVKGLTEAVGKKEARVKNREAGELEWAKQQFEDGTDFRSPKNKPAADSHQGTVKSTSDDLGNIARQQDKARAYSDTDGGFDPPVREVQVERAARTAKDSKDVVRGVLKKLMSSSYFQQTEQALKAKNISLDEAYQESIQFLQYLGTGREAAELTPEQFLAGLKREKRDLGFGEIDVVVPRQARTLDLIIGSLINEIRETGLSGRELADIVDLHDVDGPAKGLLDKLQFAVTERKKAGYAAGAGLKQFDLANRGKPSKAATEEFLNAKIEESKDSLKAMFQLADEQPTDDLSKAIFELFSGPKGINTIDDFDNWAKSTIRGGDFKGKLQNGQLVRELQGVFVASTLSGPKTPVRAILGTSTATFLRPLSALVGASLRFDGRTFREAMASSNAMIEAIPDAFKLFQTRLQSYWSGDIATYSSRYQEKTASDLNWEALGQWAETRGTDGDKAAYRLANVARNLNNNNFLNYSTKIMAATDDAFGYIIGRAKMRERAFVQATNKLDVGDFTEITPELMKSYEDNFYGQIFNSDGTIKAEALDVQYQKKEATLTKDLEGFSKGLNDLFEKTPWAKPFFLFARTGVNGLELTAKHTPIFNRLVQENNLIRRATADNLESVRQYGITTPEQLAQAKAVMDGRIAIGSSVVFMAGMAYMRGDLSGDGPPDRSKLRTWIDGGWKRRRLTVGGVTVDYDAIEPFNQLFAAVANIGDYAEMMGDEWAENHLQKLAIVIGNTMASKSYLVGLQQMVDMMTFKPGAVPRTAASILNNALPLSSMRNEMGKLLNPYMRELNSGINDSLRNRNLLMEPLAVKELPVKYDILNGQPIKNYDFMTRMFNMFSPVQVNLDYSPGRKLLYESGYSTRLSTFTAPDGTNLRRQPAIRSEFQRAIGTQNLEAKLNKLAKNPKILASIKQMKKDAYTMNSDLDPNKSYYHLKIINKLFREAERVAWAQVSQKPEVRALIEEARKLKVRQRRKLEQTKTYQDSINPLLNIYK